MYLTSPFQFFKQYVYLYMDLSHNKIYMYVIYVYILRTHICKYIVHGLKKHVSLIPLSIKHETLNLA